VAGVWRLVAQVEVLLVCGNADCEQVWPAEQLKPGRDLLVIQVGIVTAVAADDLLQVGVGAFCMAVHDSGRLAPQNHRPAVSGLITVAKPPSFALDTPRVAPHAGPPPGSFTLPGYGTRWSSQTLTTARPHHLNGVRFRFLHEGVEMLT
jgi:hypothetical protein